MRRVALVLLAWCALSVLVAALWSWTLRRIERRRLHVIRGLARSAPRRTRMLRVRMTGNDNGRR